MKATLFVRTSAFESANLGDQAKVHLNDLEITNFLNKRNYTS